MGFQDGLIPGCERRINLDKENQNDPWVTVVWIDLENDGDYLHVTTVSASEIVSNGTLPWKYLPSIKYTILRGKTEEVNVKPSGYSLEKK